MAKSENNKPVFNITGNTIGQQNNAGRDLYINTNNVQGIINKLDIIKEQILAEPEVARENGIDAKSLISQIEEIKDRILKSVGTKAEVVEKVKKISGAIFGIAKWAGIVKVLGDIVNEYTG